MKDFINAATAYGGTAFGAFALCVGLMVVWSLICVSQFLVNTSVRTKREPILRFSGIALNAFCILSLLWGFQRLDDLIWGNAVHLSAEEQLGELRAAMKGVFNGFTCVCLAQIGGLSSIRISRRDVSLEGAPNVENPPSSRP